MKYSLILLFLFCSLFVTAQDLPKFFQQNDNLKKWFIQSTREERENVVSSLKGDETFEWVFYTISEGDSSIIDSFDFLDFDRDGIKDLIYQGFIGGESKFVVLLKGTDTGYKEVCTLAGKIYWTNIPKQKNRLQFRIHNYPCCAGRVDILESYSLKMTEENKCEFILTNKEAFMNETEFPDQKLIHPIRFETINDPYTLRLSPKIDEETEYWGTTEKGNWIAYFPKGSTGTALSETTDDTGRIWWFVLMSESKDNPGMFIQGDNNKAPYRCYGWMSSRYVNIIE